MPRLAALSVLAAAARQCSDADVILDVVELLTTLVGDGTNAPAKPLPQWSQREGIIRALDSLRCCRVNLGRATMIPIARSVASALCGVVQREVHEGGGILRVRFNQSNYSVSVLDPRVSGSGLCAVSVSCYLLRFRPNALIVCLL